MLGAKAKHDTATETRRLTTTADVKPAETIPRHR
jgi:hypothetical protein